MKNFIKKIGKRISDERKLQDLSQEQLAELARINVSYLASVERGRYSSVGIANLRKICKALNFKMSDLFEGY